MPPTHKELITRPDVCHLQQKARDNRAALRINKVQMSNETIKRQQQPLEVFDPAIPPLDPELLFKDPLKHKESEQEQEWKLRQVKPCQANTHLKTPHYPARY